MKAENLKRPLLSAADTNTSLEVAETIIVGIAAVIGILEVTFIIIKLNKRIPLNFAVNLCFYTVAFISRAFNVVIYLKAQRDATKIIINGLCVGLIELSLQWLTFQVLKFQAKIVS